MLPQWRGASPPLIRISQLEPGPRDGLVEPAPPPPPPHLLRRVSREGDAKFLSEFDDFDQRTFFPPFLLLPGKRCVSAPIEARAEAPRETVGEVQG